MALVLVLGVLVLLSTLVVAFMTAVSLDRKTSSQYASQTNVRMLADSAVNLIIAQLKQASGGTGRAWASQPGLIRTYDLNGAPDIAYKLYSSHTMQAHGAFDASSDLPTPDASLSESPLWADLNSPVTFNGKLSYPILDPRLFASDGTSQVDGLSLSALDYAEADSSDAARLGKLALPVRWLYVLQDGSLAAASDAGDSAVTVADATAVNPIVARIAFWTDDESSKININTSAGHENRIGDDRLGYAGSYFDVPYASTKFERDILAFNQPANREFQRYPGHPATTSISGIFPELSISEIFRLTPRVNGGGSEGGTRFASTAISPDQDRLYATVDELRYQPTLDDQKKRLVNQAGAVSMDANVIDRMRFLLTTNSNSPEVNLFNKPRVSIWPMSTDDPKAPTTAHQETKWTAFEKLIAFAATLKNETVTQPFYYTRSAEPFVGAWSPQLDFSEQNQRIHDYLKRLTNVPMPGFGPRTFVSKYGADRDEILTCIYDYIRSNVSLNNAEMDKLSFGYLQKDRWAIRGNGEVRPIELPDGSRGLGRIATLSEAAVVFVATHEQGNAKPATPKYMRMLLLFEPFVPAPGYPLYIPGFGIKATGLNNNFVVNGQPVKFGSRDGKFMNIRKTPKAPGASSAGHGRKFGGTQGLDVLPMTAQAEFANTANSGDQPQAPLKLDDEQEKKFYFYSDPIDISANPQFSFSSSAPIKVELIKSRAPVGSTYTVDYGTYQTFHFRFPSFTRDNPGWGVLTDGAQTWVKLNSGVPDANNVNGDAWRKQRPQIQDKNVVQSILPVVSDFRLLAGMKEVPASYFTPHKNYGKQQLAHDFMYLEGVPYQGGEFGGLVKGVDYSAGQRLTNTRAETAAALTYNGAPGDWDNGIAYLPDGPYINKVDEGNIKNLAAGTTDVPYFRAEGDVAETGSANFSPNRQLPSAVMFGSLPTGIKKTEQEAIAAASQNKLLAASDTRPWQTLLFHPQPDHPGAQSPPDHLFLDLFHMPVVEPYPISDRFSTAGKINLNRSIAPFNYVRRDTSLYGLLASARVMAIPTTDGTIYKQWSDLTKNNNSVLDKNYRKLINPAETIKAMDNYLQAQKRDVFLSASEICGVELVPEGENAEEMDAFWDKHRLTGDNMRERPYSHIFPRVTTRSNTYTVHVRVQTLKKVPGTPIDGFAKGRDQVTGEFRGAFVIERFLDPNKQLFDIMDPAATLGPYKFRVVSSKQFGQ